MNAVADKLRAARTLIERGWTQGKFRKYLDDDTCSYCADGAIAEVSLPHEGAIYKHAIRALQKAMGVKEHAFMWAWNDRPGRTQAEVLAAFDKAIELAEAGQ